MLDVAEILTSVKCTHKIVCSNFDVNNMRIEFSDNTTIGYIDFTTIWIDLEAYTFDTLDDIFECGKTRMQTENSELISKSESSS